MYHVIHKPVRVSKDVLVINSVMVDLTLCVLVYMHPEEGTSLWHKIFNVVDQTKVVWLFLFFSF
jgi:hypothetical protein